MAEITREELLARYAAGKRDFRRLNLSGIIFGECILNNCDFRGANFSYAEFSGTEIVYCDFRHAIFYASDLSHCIFSNSNFTGATMRRVYFAGGDGTNATFENVDFRGTRGIFGGYGFSVRNCIRNCLRDEKLYIEFFNGEKILERIDMEYVLNWDDVPETYTPDWKSTLIYALDGTEIPF